MRNRKQWTASELLVTWGLIYHSGRLTDCIRRIGTGETEGADEEQLAATYVETCPGYHTSLPVLRHVYVYHHEPHTFDPCLPGETLERAVERHGWHSALGLPRKQVGPWVHDRFLHALIDQTRVRPFTFTRQIEEQVLPLRAKMA